MEGVIKKIGDLVEYPENDRRHAHGENGSVEDQSQDGSRNGEFTPDEGDQNELGCQIKENGDAREDCREVPFALAENWIETLHEESRDSEKQNRVTKTQRLDGLSIDFRIRDDGREVAMGIP